MLKSARIASQPALRWLGSRVRRGLSPRHVSMMTCSDAAQQRAGHSLVQATSLHEHGAHTNIVLQPSRHAPHRTQPTSSPRSDARRFAARATRCSPRIQHTAAIAHHWSSPATIGILRESTSNYGTRPLYRQRMLVQSSFNCDMTGISQNY
jgi:hypothetical protein